MKIKKGFVLNKMSEGFFVVVGVGEVANSLKGYLTLNESGAFIWQLLEKGLSKQEIVNSILSEYEVEESVVSSDVDNIILKLKEIGALDD